MAVLAHPAWADPLGLVDYDALMAANPNRTFCTGDRLCTVILPGGSVVQQDGDGDWLAGGDDLTAGSFALGYGLILAISDHCDRLPDGIEREALEAGLAEMQSVYRQSLSRGTLGQTEPSPDRVAAAFLDLRGQLATFVTRDPELSGCEVPDALAALLAEMTQESYWGPELTRLREAPTLPTANFAIE